MNHHELPLDKCKKPKDGVDPIDSLGGSRFLAGWGPIFLGQPFPEQSEELRLEAIMMGGCKQRLFKYNRNGS